MGAELKAGMDMWWCGDESRVERGHGVVGGVGMEAELKVSMEMWVV